MQCNQKWRKLDTDLAPDLSRSANPGYSEAVSTQFGQSLDTPKLAQFGSGLRLQLDQVHSPNFHAHFISVNAFCAHYFAGKLHWTF